MHANTSHTVQRCLQEQLLRQIPYSFSMATKTATIGYKHSEEIFTVARYVPVTQRHEEFNNIHDAQRTPDIFRDYLARNDKPFVFFGVENYCSIRPLSATDENKTML